MRILAVTNIYPTPKTPTSGTFIEQQIKGLREIGLEVQVMLVDRTHEGMSVYLKVPRQLQAMIKILDPEVVHVMYGGIMAAQVTRTVKDRPVVVTFHGSDLLGENLSGSLRKWIGSVGVRASWKAARQASGIVLVSRRLQEALPKTVNLAKVKIIPCGIDLNLFKSLDRNNCRELLGWKKDIYHVLFATNSDDPVKRPQLAQAAVDTLSHLGIPAEMHYLRAVPYKEVPVWLNASNVLLLTSLHEGSPTIIKEALACNLPIVSVDVGDVGERILGVSGCYLALPNPNDLAVKLSMVYRDKSRSAARDKIQDLCLTSIASKLKTVYSEVV